MSDEQNMTSETVQAVPVESSAPLWYRRIIQVAGLFLMLFGLPAMLNLVCIFPIMTVNDFGSDTALYGVVSLTLALLTAGMGLAAFIHGSNSLQNKPSKPLWIPPIPLFFVGAFLFLLALGMVINRREAFAGLFLAPILVVCAILPPLWAVSWMIPQAQVSWRRGLMSFAGGTTVSVFIAIVLEVLFPVIILSLVFNLTDTVSEQVNALFRALSNENVAEALTDRGFIYIFVQIAIIAPLVEELAKPLVILPLLKKLGKQESFWVGALAGAGFAALENIIYAASGFAIWAGILLVRSLGGALHPLGSGLVAQGWHGVLRGEKDAAKNWWKRFGIAVAVHAAWNGGSLLVITLGGARFFGELPAELDLLGLSAAGTTLAFLIVLGIAALWIGRAYGHNKTLLAVEGETAPDESFVPTDRAAALWAVVCLIALVPAGIAGLKLWL